MVLYIGLTTAFSPSDGETAVMRRMRVPKAGSVTAPPTGGAASGCSGWEARSWTSPSQSPASPDGGEGVLTGGVGVGAGEAEGDGEGLGDGPASSRPQAAPMSASDGAARQDRAARRTG